MIVHDSKMLLGRKQRKIGEGFLVAPGGKVEEGESITESLIRETEEESGLLVKNPKAVGIITIQNDPNKEEVIEMHVYLAKEFEGDLKSTDQVADWAWYPNNNLPYRQMFPDDEFWMSLILQGRRVEAEFILDHPPTAQNPSKVIYYSVNQPDEKKKAKLNEIKLK
jgi:ADP-ribose pyrophosphatase YjhB (NUDIX family)